MSLPKVRKPDTKKGIRPAIKTVICGPMKSATRMASLINIQIMNVISKVAMNLFYRRGIVMTEGTKQATKRAIMMDIKKDTIMAMRTATEKESWSQNLRCLSFQIIIKQLFKRSI